MTQITEWQESQKELTRDILERNNYISFAVGASDLGKGCILEHLDGSTGYITLPDAINDNWRVFDFETDELLHSYHSIEAVIDAGWKIHL